VSWLILALWLVTPLFCAKAVAEEEEFSFETAEFKKKPYEIGGYVELLPEFQYFNTEGALYELNFAGTDEQTTVLSTNSYELTGLLRYGMATFSTTVHGELLVDREGTDEGTELFESFISLKPNASATVEAGKRSLQWGKGIAWNPVGFIQRPKDPNDPTLSREGFLMALGDFIKTFEGPLRTVAFTPVVVPTYWENLEFGERDHLNPAAKLYLLYRDIDIDLMFLGEGSRTARYGFDFSTNLATNFEIHGEFAYITDVQKNFVDPTGKRLTETEDEVSYLLGLRYLTEEEVTFIAEYYHDGTNFSQTQAEDFFSFVHTATDTFERTGNETDLNRARGLRQRGFGRANLMQDYLYLRVSVKEPFDILYFTPSIFSIVNLNDGSFSITPELVYQGINNLELRFRAPILVGDPLTEYGERQNEFRLELRVRYFF
jgi:hypothetical protein